LGLGLGWRSAPDDRVGRHVDLAPHAIVRLLVRVRVWVS
jgi:hypothetical protein